MLRIGCTREGKTKNPKEDSEAVQILTIAESYHPLPRGCGGRREGCSRWKVSVGARDIALALDTGREGEKHPGFSPPSPSSPVPSMG